ncbi:MAG: hypothetical protein K0S61_737 [Anaerocolumna sp.]|jgi:hypothetical protein|nr:hypothetical protein [Anaerocolumna sp.]
MIFILDNKKYDTEKSEEIYKFRRKYPRGTLFNMPMYYLDSMVLYRTQKGNWFSVRETESQKFIAYMETDGSVKEIFSNLNEVELIEKYFGNIDEA